MKTKTSASRHRSVENSTTPEIILIYKILRNFAVPVDLKIIIDLNMNFTILANLKPGGIISTWFLVIPPNYCYPVTVSENKDLYTAQQKNKPQKLLLKLLIEKIISRYSITITYVFRNIKKKYHYIWQVTWDSVFFSWSW